MRLDQLNTVNYFAYGHNTQAETIRERCPSARLVGTGVLHNFRLTFHKYANIENHDGEQVQGVVWNISESDLHHLDDDEGFHVHYTRIPVEVLVEGVPTRCTAYIMESAYHPAELPSPSYIQHVRKGYEEHGLPLSQLEQAVERLDNQK